MGKAAGWHLQRMAFVPTVQLPGNERARSAQQSVEGLDSSPDAVANSCHRDPS